MSKKSTTQSTQNQTSSSQHNYGYVPGASSADIDALRNQQFTVDPSIGYNFASARNAVANSFNSPLSGLYSPTMKDRILRSSLSDLAMKESQAHSEANQQLQGQRFGQLSTVASLTAPRLVEQSSSGTGSGSGTTIQSQSMLPDLLTGIAAGGAQGLGGAA